MIDYRIEETNNLLQATCNIAKKGFSGMQSSSPASFSLYLDSDLLRNPFLPILRSLAVIPQILEILISRANVFMRNKYYEKQISKYQNINVLQKR